MICGCIAVLLGMTSCEVAIVGGHDDYGYADGAYNSRTHLLTARTWVSFYIDGQGNSCRQELDFYKNREGVEWLRVEYPNGYVRTFEHRFRWEWDNLAQTSLRMAYGANDVSFLDEVSLNYNRLSGFLDGRNTLVEYRPK